MPFIPIIIKFILGNWKKIAFGAAALIVANFMYSTVVSWLDAREDRQTLECNEEQLQNTVDSLEEQLRIAREDIDRRAAENVELREEANRRAEYTRELEDILNDNSISDDRISDRTREFWRRMNEQAKEIQNEEPIDPTS